jgi:hypothetical protein
MAARPHYDVSGDIHLAELEALERLVIDEGYTTYQEPLDLAPYVAPALVGKRSSGSAAPNVTTRR